MKNTKKIENIIAEVEKQLETKSIREYLKEEGMWMYGQNFGRRAVLEVNPETGKLSTYTSSPNSYAADNNIEIASHGLMEKNDSDICDGANEVFDAETIANNLDINTEEIKEYCVENEIDCEEISWSDIHADFSIQGEAWVEKLIGEDWQDWEDNYINYVLEDIEETENFLTDKETGSCYQGNWRDGIKQYFENK